jgi:predicted glutamine amidotransferase
MIASSLPETVVLNHLLNSTYSLKNLGAINNDGWGLAYYDDCQPVVLRGEMPAYTDPNFTLAAQELATSGAHIGVGHVRLAASGASDIPNPHPFIRYKAGKWWAFGHNGVLSKTVLKNLIGPEYLAENPPQIGENWDDPDVVDSDLYMLYVLKCIEENNWVVIDGLVKAVTDISEADSGAMNFFLSDGETVWGFRRGNTLYYYYNETFPQYSALASQPPTNIQDGWIALYDYSLVILTANNPPSVIVDMRAISEFSTQLTLPLFVITTLGVAAIYRRRKLSNHEKTATKMDQ